MTVFKQKINWSAIWGQIGLLLHVPAVMALITIGISIIFKDFFAILPLAVVAALGIGIGQLLYRLRKKRAKARLWDAMLIAALGWVFCSLIAAIPFYWISHTLIKSGADSPLLVIFSNPLNAIFESFSGFTSTGLTMLQGEGFFPCTLQWWRSFLQWTGGLGLVVFVLSLTHLNKEGFQLYYAEARSEQMFRNITQTAHWIWRIYFFYTIIAFLLFWVAGMPTWEAINHALTGISTGGFTITPTSFDGYGVAIKIITVFTMLIGSISFTVHFYVINKHRWKALWKSLQLRLLYLFLFGGGVLVVAVNQLNASHGEKIDSFFEWTSAITTCGFSAVNPSFFSPMVKLLIIMGMFLGGSTGSTSGGLKIRRLIYLISAIFLRLASITSKKEKKIVGHYRKSNQPNKKEPPGTHLPHSAKSERLFTAGVLFSLWASTLFLGWFLMLKWTPHGHALDTLFDVTSAMSNVGLSSGMLTPDFPAAGKSIFILLMWIGRLEIIPALVLVLTIPMSFRQKRSNGKSHK